MLKLNSAAEYIRHTVEIMSVATGMEVIICDEQGKVIADSDYVKTKDVDLREDPMMLSDTSVLRRAIVTGREAVVKNCRLENPACMKCVNASVCKITSVFAYPIKEDETVLGGVGIFANTKEAHKTILEKSDMLVEFTHRISELMLGKLHDDERYVANAAMSERLRLLIESLDDAMLIINEDDGVECINVRFSEMFGMPRDMRMNLQELTAALDSDEFEEFIRTGFSRRKPVKKIVYIRNKATTVAFKPVFVDKLYKGGLMSFKVNADIYKEFNVSSGDYALGSFDDIVGSSMLINSLKERAKNFARSPSTIFIRGNSGTGKEVFAQAIHRESLVREGPFIAVNCAAIPANLMESELFGHKEGAFTGSMRGGKVGKFEFANNGTLFLDEVGELPLTLQPKLLRAIQEKRIQPVGSNKYIPVNIRIIAATNRNMEEMVKNGEFREDLYYRLNVIPLMLPDLKERREDIEALSQFFLNRYNKMLDKNIIGFDKAAENLLHNYSWPGNIRELQNVVEYAVNDCTGKYIEIGNLPKKDYGAPLKKMDTELQTMRDIEKYYISKALHIYGSNTQGKEAAAKALGLSRATFYRKIKEYKIE